MSARLWNRTVFSILLAAGVVALSEQARASVISGVFAGVATTGTFQTTTGSVDVSGSAITGSFDVSSLVGAAPLPGGSPGTYLLPSGSISYSFFISKINQTTTFGSPPTRSSGYLDLADNGTRQNVTLSASFADPSVITSLNLAGPEGSLFDSVTDVGSLHAGPGVTLVSPISLSIRFQGSASVALTSQSIPEPASWAILAGCLAALTCIHAFAGAQRCATSKQVRQA